jgi:dipeptidyl aminopeptidase/acylaminoacyl peptidase
MERQELMRRRVCTGLGAGFALLLIGWAPALAQTSPMENGNGKRTLTPEDYGQFERLGGATLSRNGAWLAVGTTRVNEENELRVRPVANPDSVIAVPYGRGPIFSDDSGWLAYSIGVSEDEREAMTKRREPVRSKVGIVDLRSGEVTTVDAVASFAFSPDSRYLAMRRYPPEGDRDAEGVDLVVRDLERGTDTNFGNVGEFAWQDDQPLLAMLVDAEGMAGNGVQLFDASAGRLSTLESTATRYSGLTWREDAFDLAVFREIPGADDDEAEEEAGEEAKEAAGAADEAAERDEDQEEAAAGLEFLDTAYVAVAFSGLDRVSGRTPAAVRTLDPSVTAGFPDGHRIVPWEPLRWSESGGTLVVGLKEREAAPLYCEEDDDEEEGGEAEVGDADQGDDAECTPKPDDEDAPTVEIWHAADVDIIPTQKVTANRDRQDNHLSAWHLSQNRLVQLENDLTETVRWVDDARRLMATDRTAHDADRMFGPDYSDVYVVDVETGQRDKVLDRIQYAYGMSPGGRYLLYLVDDHYWAYDTETHESVCLTDGLPTSFVDVEDDHTVEQKPPFGTGGWLEGDAAVLLYDKHDVWRVAPDGSGGERVTMGAESNVRHRRVRIDPEERAIDPGAVQWFSLYDDWTEASGYGRSDRLGRDVGRLAYGDARYSSLQKAEDADVFAYQVQTFEDSPDYFVGGPALSDARQITRTNAFQGDYLWGRGELIEFDNTWGEHLQGALFYPADYVPGRQYPMIVYIYEIVSNGLHTYHIPSERDYYDFQAWSQNGYFLFQPDIVYQDRNPGLGAMATLEPAVAAVVATGMVDPERVGLIGHSWGGYQTTFAVTQTDIFAAAVAGAPLTNLFSMYLSVYWNSGGTDARIFEISQGRMEVPFWEDEGAYRANSPVFHIENMTTPLLMAQGTEDGAVDFNQGVEFYNAARRAGKDFVFFVFNEENHGFSQKANQTFYHDRIIEWFGHYLKGDPAPDWITGGVSFLEQEKAKERTGGGEGGAGGGRGGGPGGGGRGAGPGGA